jgi:hypothetical protein
MRRLVSRFAVAAACALPVLLAACDSTTEPAENLAVSLEFNVSRPAFMPPFSTARTGRDLLFRGRIETVCQPADPSATVAREGEAIVLTVRLTSAADCSPSAAQVNYDASITGIGRLTRFRVIHSWPGTDREDMVAYESIWE